MAFAIAPLTGVRPDPAAAFPKFMQFRSAGTNLGDLGVRVVDIVGDPVRVLATRGVGENSHIVTIKLTPI